MEELLNLVQTHGTALVTLNVFLTQLGFARVRPLQGGLDAWMEAGFAIEGERHVGYQSN
ncbi:MAG: hypothetical protein NDJ89_13075 [Oligoflexia bacterium]|nr:hypothetical protein [Oligoflexia bacterium]